jgi:NADH:ubiquinone oxidoreductase subunit 6 (subunit J)
VKGLGVTLMQDHYVSLEVIGVLLLVAVAGAVLIATHRLEPKR